MKSIIVSSFVCLATAAVLAQSVTAPGGQAVATKLKDAGKAMLAYANDYDNHLPLAFARNAQGKNLSNQVRAVPAVDRMDQQVWANTLASYWVKDTLKIDAPTYPWNDHKSGDAIGITMNGLLHTYEVSSVANEKVIPLLWTPFGKANTFGALANPGMRCYDIDRCIFQNENVSTAVYSGPSEVKPFGDHLYEITLDLSVKTHKAFIEVRDWKTGFYVYGSPTYGTNGKIYHGLVSGARVQENGSPNGNTYSLHFAPDRLD